jgi:hypothetical protein
MYLEQGTSGRLWKFLPDRTRAEIVSGLRPDMVAGFPVKPKKPTIFFLTLSPVWPYTFWVATTARPMLASCHNALAAQPGRDVLQGRPGAPCCPRGRSGRWRWPRPPLAHRTTWTRTRRTWPPPRTWCSSALQQGVPIPLAALVAKQSTQLYMPFHASMVESVTPFPFLGLGGSR